MTPEELAAFDRLEAAIDTHPSGLKRMGETECVVMRSGYTAAVLVKHVKTRKQKPVRIWANGDSWDEACDSLIRKLDSWSAVM